MPRWPPPESRTASNTSGRTWRRSRGRLTGERLDNTTMGGRLSCPALPFERPGEHQVRVVLVRVPLENLPQLRLGAAELRGVVVRAGQQHPGADVVRVLVHHLGELRRGLPVLLALEVHATDAMPERIRVTHA